MTRRLLVLLLACIILAGCDYATDPVRLGKQAVSDANAYDIRTQADQDALDQEQERLTRERQDQIMLAENKQQSEIYLTQARKVAPWIGASIIIAALGVALGIFIVMLGNSSATVIRQNAAALREFRRAAELHPGENGVYPMLVLPDRVNVRVLSPGTQSVLSSRNERHTSRKQLEAHNELAVKATIAGKQVMAGNEHPLVIMAQPVPQRKRIPAEVKR